MTKPTQNLCVTVVIPAYNAGRYLAECCESVIRQDINDWRCLVIDDGSTDDSLAAVGLYRDPRITIVHQNNGGVSSARNLGLAFVTTAHVMFLDADDKLHPTALRRLHEKLVQEPVAAAVFGTFIKILENGNIAPYQKPLHRHRYPSGNVLNNMLRENFLANGGHVLVRTSLARQIGGFNENLKLSEDWEFWCRLASRGSFYFIGRSPETLYLRLRRGSASSLALDWAEHQRSIEAVLHNQELKTVYGTNDWARLSSIVKASHMWEAGRANFTSRKFREANKLMVRSLSLDLTARRVVLFFLAQISRALNVSFISRLRFVDHDYPDE